MHRGSLATPPRFFEHLVCPGIATRESSELIAVTIPIIRVALEMLSSLAKRGRVEEALS